MNVSSKLSKNVCVSGESYKAGLACGSSSDVCEPGNRIGPYATAQSPEGRSTERIKVLLRAQDVTYAAVHSLPLPR